MDLGRSLRIFWSRYTAAFCTGLLLALPFDFTAVSSVAWLAPGLLLLTAVGQPPGAAFRLGYLGGLGFYLGSLYWLLFMPVPAGAVAAWLALSAFLALYPAVWTWLGAGWLKPHGAANPGVGNERQTETGALSSTGTWGGLLLERSFAERLLWSVACAALWVALEMIRARFLSGFPWNLLGASQWPVLPVIQIASVTGVYGVSFVIAWFSISLAIAAVSLIHRPRASWAFLREIIPAVALLAGVLIFGFYQLAHTPASERSVKLALIQPSIPQTLIWDPKEDTNRFNALIKLSQEALRNKPDILVWPEAAVPNYVRYDVEFTLPAITNLVRAANVWLIMGADDAAPRPGATNPDDYDSFNTSMLVDPRGQLEAVYRKQRLVIFGEYIPLVHWLPFLKWFTPVRSGFTPGDRPVPFSIPPLGIKTSVLICFEDVFPQLARQYARNDIDFLLNLTNDGWFGESAAQWQHAGGAVFRAVENGLPLVRCANNGLTCWISATGATHAVYFPGSRDVYKEGYKIVQVPVLPRQQTRTPTVYNRYGDWFGWACVLGAGLRVATQVIGRRRARRQKP